MTPRELDLLVRVFDAFLSADGEFLVTNASMQGIAHEIGGRLQNASEPHDALLEHFIEHAAEERDRLLAEAGLRGDVAIFYGKPRVVLTENSANSLAKRPSPRGPRGV